MQVNLRLFLVTSILFLGINQAMAQTQFVNPGFEEWEEIGFGPEILEPVNWSSIKSSDDEGINVNAPMVWGQSEDAHSGNYSLYLFTVSFFNIVVPGTITNGRIHTSAIPDSGYTYTDPDNTRWHTRLIAKPDSLTGWYKANPMPGDFAKLKAVVHRGYLAISESLDTSDFIGSGTLYLSGEPVDTWTRFSMPINYYLDEDPEFILLTVSSSKGTDAIAGSELWLDDLELIYNNGTGVAEENPDNLHIFTTDKQLNILVTGETNQEYNLSVFDLSGKLRLEGKGNLNQKKYFAYDLPKGIYIVSIEYEHKVLTKKIRL